MKKVTKHIYSAGGHYIGSEEVPYWQSRVKTSTAIATIIIAFVSILIGLGIIIGLNGLPKSHNSKVNITNALPF